MPSQGHPTPPGRDPVPVRGPRGRPAPYGGAMSETAAAPSFPPRLLVAKSRYERLREVKRKNTSPFYFSGSSRKRFLQSLIKFSSADYMSSLR